MKKKILKITLSVVLILILAVGLGLAYLVGAAALRQKQDTLSSLIGKVTVLQTMWVL